MKKKNTKAKSKNKIKGNFVRDVLSEEELIEINSSLNNLDSEDFDCDEKDEIEKVQIFGTDGKNILPILTDSKGRLVISANIIIPPVYYKQIELKNIVTANPYKFTQAFDVSRLTRTSFIVMNQDSNSATVQLQDSPDGMNYQIDVPEREIEPNTFVVFTPTRFVRFQRLAYRSTISNEATKLDIFFQAQGNQESV